MFLCCIPVYFVFALLYGVYRWKWDGNIIQSYRSGIRCHTRQGRGIYREFDWELEHLMKRRAIMVMNRDCMNSISMVKNLGNDVLPMCATINPNY